MNATREHDLSGHRRTALGRSPFWDAFPSIVAAASFALATLTWVLVGDHLPGGRWLAVHLFTLGVLTNLVLAFSEHFARTVTRVPEERGAWQAPTANAGILAVLVGIPTGTDALVGAGATVVTAVVFLGYWRIRRMRKRSIGARFAWIARLYERAHGAFIHGATLGLLMGVGWLSGRWYGSARLAHLHINVLGWGGLTLLATLVFFGPSIVRTRIEPGADARAARALRHGATALTVGVLLLLATGVGGGAATALRVAAAAGLAVFAWATTTVCVPVARAARNAKPSATRWPVVATAVWFPLVVWADVGVVAAGEWRYLDALGLVALAGVLGQAIVTTLTYLAPMLRGRTFGARDVVLARLERFATPRAVLFNLAVLAIGVTAAGGRDLGTAGAVGAGTGWVLVTLLVVQTLLVGVWPVRGRADDEAVSQVARRYRDPSAAQDPT